MSDRPAISDLLAVNGPLFQEIDRMIVRAARDYAAGREGGSSESMNGALDYITLSICKRICEAAGEEQVWHNAKLAVAPQAPEPSGRMNGAYTEPAKMPRAGVKLWPDPAFKPFDRWPDES